MEAFGGAAGRHPPVEKHTAGEAQESSADHELTYSNTAVV